MNLLLQGFNFFFVSFQKKLLEPVNIFQCMCANLLSESVAMSVGGNWSQTSNKSVAQYWNENENNTIKLINSYSISLFCSVFFFTVLIRQDKAAEKRRNVSGLLSNLLCKWNAEV